MAYYYLQNSIPKFTFIKKENIPALTGTVISSQYYFSIQDYENLNLTINNLNDSITKIFSFNKFFLDEDGLISLSTLSSNIDKIINNNFINIHLLNGVPISTSHIQNINVLKYFKINNVYYGFNDENKGNVEVFDRYISGKPKDYVQSFNGRWGNVSGAIEKIIVNNEVLPIIDGLVTISGLIYEGDKVISVDGLYENIKLLYTLKVFDDLELTATEENQGKVVINTLFYKNSNMLNNNFTLDNVDENNENTAITKDFLKNYSNNNYIIQIKQLTISLRITLNKDLYPLHFYDANGNWLKDIKWTEEVNDNNPKIHNFRISGTGIAKYTIMKVN